MADTYLKITLVRSPIGYKKYQGITARALGLRRLHYTVVHKETPSIRGMITQIGHLLKVEETTQDEYAKYAATRSTYWRGGDDAAQADAAEPQTESE